MVAWWIGPGTVRPGGAQVRVLTASYSPHGGLSIACGAPGVHGRLEVMPHAPGWRGPPVGAPPEGRSPLMARGDAMGRRQRHHTRISSCARSEHGPTTGRGSALHQFDTDAVGCGDITQPSPPDLFLQGHGNAHPLSAQLVAEGAPVPVVEEAEGISPPGIVAGVISVRLSCSGSRGSLAGPLAPNDQGLATKLEEDGVIYPTPKKRYISQATWSLTM
jgi:hypothetical protein